MDFKFVSHGLWSEKQSILLQHMHKKEFWILTNKCGNNLKHENEAVEPWLFSLVFVLMIISTFILFQILNLQLPIDFKSLIELLIDFKMLKQRCVSENVLFFSFRLH